MPGPVPDAAPADDALPAVPVLLGLGASDVLAPAVAAHGGRIESTRPRFVNYRPGSRISIRYSARVAWPGGRTTDETLVAHADRRGPPRGAGTAEVAGTQVGIWRWPDDPRLPGLRAALDPDFVRGLLVPGAAPAGPIELRRRTYWPGNRAVLRAIVPTNKLRFDPASGRVAQAPPEQALFVKVVRPSRVERLVHLHSELAGRLPVARCLGHSRELGIVCLEALPGQTISSCLAAGSDEPPDPDALLKLLLSLEGAGAGGEPRRTTGRKIATHVRLLEAVLPDEAAALHRFAELYGDEAQQPLTTVHGDFHEEQVLARGGRVTGLLDVDDVGPGQLVDDLALMIGRVRARGEFGRDGRDRALAYERALVARFGAATDPRELRRRAAGALLGRATAPFRGQIPGWRAASRERIRFAEAALSAAQRD